jgi:AraC-like DNA-binding protein
MDPLSDVLALLRPQGYAFRGLSAGGAWSIDFPEDAGVKCYALSSGRCHLLVDGVPDPIELAAGDCVLLPRGRQFLLASDLSAPPIDAEAFFSAVRTGGVAMLNDGGDLFGVGGYFEFSSHHADVLLGLLPPVIHVREEADKASLRWCLERLMEEMREPQPGGALIAGHLAQMLLVQALRLHLTEHASAGVGWIFALADRRMRLAIEAMHESPARAWTLQTLSEVAAMSRSAFAARFKSTVGTSAMDYLTRWRMLLAADRLLHSGDYVAVIAPSLGYESESAFSTAFKRVMGCSPREYSRGRGNATQARDALGTSAAVAATRWFPPVLVRH